MQAWTTVDWAQDGDTSYLVARLRDPACTMTMRERTYLADMIEGKLPPARHTAR